jgi:hypothetical protein
MSIIIDITGQRFGRLTVVACAGRTNGATPHGPAVVTAEGKAEQPTLPARRAGQETTRGAAALDLTDHAAWLALKGLRRVRSDAHPFGR